MEEIYLLTKHANFSAEYVERIPIYKRRYYTHLLKKEVDEIKRQQDKSQSDAKSRSFLRR